MACNLVIPIAVLADCAWITYLTENHVAISHINLQIHKALSLNHNQI